MATGIDFVDSAAGGFTRDKPYLVFGRSGTGKSIFGMQFVHAGLLQGQGALYVCREKASDLIQQGERLGFRLTEHVDAERLVLLEYDVGFRDIVNTAGPAAVLEDLRREIGDRPVHRVVFDPVDPFFSSLDDESTLRAELRALTDGLESLGWTPLLLCDDTTVSQPPFVLRVFSEVCWGLFELQGGAAGAGEGSESSLLVYKMRNVELARSRFAFRIGEGGIRSPGGAGPAGARRGFTRFRPAAPAVVAAEAALRPAEAPAGGSPAPEPPTAPTARARRHTDPEADPALAGEDLELLDESELAVLEAAVARRFGGAVAAPAPAPTPAAPARRPRALVVESQAEARARLAATLSARCDVLEAEDGVAGLRAASSQQPDLIVAAARLPRLNGLGLCRILREHGVDVPVVLLCARHPGAADRARALLVGSDAALTGPVEPDALDREVGRLLARRAPGDAWPTLDVARAGGLLRAGRVAPEALEAHIERAREWAREAGIPLCLLGYEFRFVEGPVRAFVDGFFEHLRHHVRVEDSLSRVADKRIVALLVDADEEGARAVVLRLHAHMADEAARYAGQQAVKPKALYRRLALHPDALVGESLAPPLLERLFREEPRLIEEDRDERPGEAVERFPLLEAVATALAGDATHLISPLDGSSHAIASDGPGPRHVTIGSFRYRAQVPGEESPAGHRARRGARIVWVEALEDPPRVVARIEEDRVFRGREA